MDFLATGLPVNEQVLKAFGVWRLNADAYAKETGAPFDQPLKLAKTLDAFAPHDTEAMTLALLTAVPAEATKLMTNRFGQEMVGKLEEYRLHARTGFNYVGQASETVRAVALAAAITAFSDFTAKIDDLAWRAPVSATGAARGKIQEQLGVPDAPLFERLGEKTSLPSHPGLEQRYAADREDYRGAQEAKAALINTFGAAASLAPAAPREAFAPPAFETQGLLDQPAVRAAYDVLINDTRLRPDGFEEAMTAGRLLSGHSDAKYPAAVAASLLRTGIPGFGRADLDFLDGRLDESALSVLKHCERFSTPSKLGAAPEDVRQVALAQGIVTIHNLCRDGQDLVDLLDMQGSALPAGQAQVIKSLRLESGIARAEALSDSLKNLLGTTGAPQVEQLFMAEVDKLNLFLRQNMPPRPIPVSRQLAAPKA